LDEVDKIKERYEKRINLSHRYNILNPEIIKGEQEKEMALIRWIKNCSIQPVGNKTLLDIGCGSGGNLLQFLRFGFAPENLFGNELLEERFKSARLKLPELLRLYPGDVMDLKFEKNNFDIIFQSMVFSSILDENFRINLAGQMWDWVKVGGGILWYDFIYNNPLNKDVRGVPYRKVREYFPKGEITKWKLTLAPPISRVVSKIHPSFYNYFNLFPFLRTHVLCWIRK
jgi:SAM-dependent methyltransferase